MTRAPALRWRAVTGVQIDWRAWDDEYVVRIAATATTVLLSATAGGVLMTLRSSPHGMTLDDLAGRLFEGGPEDGPTLSSSETQALTAVLDQLRELGLAATDPP